MKSVSFAEGMSSEKLDESPAQIALPINRLVFEKHNSSPSTVVHGVQFQIENVDQSPV